jgi:hypothetical protein
MLILRSYVEMGLHWLRSSESLYGRLGLDLAVLVGTGLRAGAKHNRPARRPVATGNSVDADHARYPRDQILFLFAIIFENPYMWSKPSSSSFEGNVSVPTNIQDCFVLGTPLKTYLPKIDSQRKPHKTCIRGNEMGDPPNHMVIVWSGQTAAWSMWIDCS